MIITATLLLVTERNQDSTSGTQMNIINISDLHFGPRHWPGDDGAMLEKINSYDVGIVIDTGDNTIEIPTP